MYFDTATYPSNHGNALLYYSELLHFYTLSRPFSSASRSLLAVPGLESPRQSDTVSGPSGMSMPLSGISRLAASGIRESDSI